MSRMNLDQVDEGIKRAPLRELVYGPSGAGKSSFAAAAPNPIFLDVENGTQRLNVKRFPRPANGYVWQDVLDAIEELRRNPRGYQTLVVDTLDHVEPLIFRHVCDVHGKSSIEEFAYGKGMVHALDSWRAFLRELGRLQTERGMNVLLLAHAQVRKHEPPTADQAWDRFGLKMNDKAAALLTEWANSLLFANRDYRTRINPQTKRVKGVSTDARFLWTTECAAFAAKNRYSLPDRMPLDFHEFFDFVQRGVPSDDAVRHEIEAALPQLSSETRAKGEAALKRADTPDKLAQLLNWARARLAADEEKRAAEAESMGVQPGSHDLAPDKPNAPDPPGGGGGVPASKPTSKEESRTRAGEVAKDPGPQGVPPPGGAGPSVENAKPVRAAPSEQPRSRGIGRPSLAPGEYPHGFYGRVPAPEPAKINGEGGPRPVEEVSISVATSDPEGKNLALALAPGETPQDVEDDAREWSEAEMIAAGKCLACGAGVPEGRKKLQGRAGALCSSSCEIEDAKRAEREHQEKRKAKEAERLASPNGPRVLLGGAAQTVPGTRANRDDASPEPSPRSALDVSPPSSGPSSRRAPLDEGRCRSCSASILWVKSATTGKPIPLDPPLVSFVLDENAAGSFIVSDGRTLRGLLLTADMRVAPGVAVHEGRITHFATCRSADEHRKPRSSKGKKPPAVSAP